MNTISSVSDLLDQEVLAAGKMHGSDIDPTALGMAISAATGVDSIDMGADEASRAAFVAAFRERFNALAATQEK